MGMELELLRDQDINLFIERGMRGGISMISKRYAKASNPLVEGHDTSKPTNYITYLDGNNLDRYAMSLPLTKLQMEARDAHGRAAHENERTFQEGVNTGAGPRACCPKQLHTRARERRNKK